MFRITFDDRTSKYVVVVGARTYGRYHDLELAKRRAKQVVASQGLHKKATTVAA